MPAGTTSGGPRIASALAVLIVAIACIRIAATYGVLSQTYDEPAHIATGMEWLDYGTYTLEPLHPPLARIAAAIGPYLAGRRLRVANMLQGGNDILYADGRYIQNLSLARLGELPFFILAAFITWAWSRSLFGEPVALISVLVFTMLPPILGHAGLATTDIAAAATCIAMLYAFVRWLDQGDLRRSAVLALTLGLAVLSKFTALLFLPACCLALLAGRWWRAKDARSPAAGWQKQRALAVALVALGTCLLVWSGYRFSLGPLAQIRSPLRYKTVDAFTGPAGKLHDLAYKIVLQPVPAPQFFNGLRDARGRIGDDRGAYILGRMHHGTCLYFFLVDLAVKSPLCFLILAGVGVVILFRQPQYRKQWRPLEPLIAAAAILLVTLPVQMHMGIRHILVVYPLLSIAAGFGVVSLWRSPGHRCWGGAAAVLLMAWLVLSSVRAHPDYLAYFNELAGSHPERILVDSDLDWGQDLLRLPEALRSRKVDRLCLGYFGSADPGRQGLPPFAALVPFSPTTGWVAISLTMLKGHVPGGVDGAYAWLEAYQPVALVGRSIRLYYIPATTLLHRGNAPAAGPRSQLHLAVAH